MTTATPDVTSAPAPATATDSRSAAPDGAHLSQAGSWTGLHDLDVRRAAEARIALLNELAETGPDPFAAMTLDELRAHGYPPSGPELENAVTWHQYCRALDRAWGGRKDAETAELRARQLAGDEPLPADWWGHKVYLRRVFGGRSFTASQVIEAARDDDDWVAPPRVPVSPDMMAGDPQAAATALGTAYRHAGARTHHGARIEASYVSRGVRRWRVTVNGMNGS
jgi:hypothetical protein